MIPGHGFTFHIEFFATRSHEFRSLQASRAVLIAEDSVQLVS